MVCSAGLREVPTAGGAQRSRGRGASGALPSYHYASWSSGAMVFTLKDLLVEAAQDNGPLEDYATVWRAMVRCAEDVLQSGRGISIPNFAKITIIKNSVREAPGKGHGAWTQRRASARKASRESFEPSCVVCWRVACVRPQGQGLLAIRELPADTQRHVQEARAGPAGAVRGPQRGQVVHGHTARQGLGTADDG